jgi:hypothetical protein
MRDKEKEILDAIAPENKEVNKKKRRTRGLRFGINSYVHGSTMPSPFTLKFPS